MLMRSLRFFLLRFLPRRLVPVLALLEVVQLIRRLRRQRPDPIAPRRLRTSEPPTAPSGPEIRPPRGS